MQAAGTRYAPPWAKFRTVVVLIPSFTRASALGPTRVFIAACVVTYYRTQPFSFWGLGFGFKGWRVLGVGVQGSWICFPSSSSSSSANEQTLNTKRQTLGSVACTGIDQDGMDPNDFRALGRPIFGQTLNPKP